jgi:DnaJ-class molecular chaperone
MAALGWTATPEPEPTAPATAPARCPHCNGVGEVPTLYATLSGTPAYMVCRDCHGTGRAGAADRLVA